MTFCWLILMDDLSGNEAGPWRDADQPLGEALMDLLRLCGDAYLPFMQANAAALEASREEVELEIWGTHYRQRPFRYQGKCYRILRERFAALSSDDRSRIAPVLEETGCLPYLV